VTGPEATGEARGRQRRVGTAEGRNARHINTGTWKRSRLASRLFESFGSAGATVDEPKSVNADAKPSGAVKLMVTVVPLTVICVIKVGMTTLIVSTAMVVAWLVPGGDQTRQ